MQTVRTSNKMKNRNNLTKKKKSGQTENRTNTQKLGQTQQKQTEKP